MSPRGPTFLPLYSAPWAWQASSTTIKFLFLAISKIGPISAGCPYRWTGSIALVLLVMAFFSLLTSRLYVLLSISTNLGLAPTLLMDSVVAIKVFGTVITSSPGFIPAAIKDNIKAEEPLLTPMPNLALTYLENSDSKEDTLSPPIKDALSTMPFMALSTSSLIARYCFFKSTNFISSIWL